MIALEHAAAPFSKVVLAEQDEENADILRKRMQIYQERVRVIQGDCNETIDTIMEEVPVYGLNIALIDPYKLRTLSFDTLQKIARVKRMDLIVHFPTMDIKRNFNRASTFITRFLGTDVWKDSVKRPGDVVKLVEILKAQLGAFGYEQEKVRTLPIAQSKGVPIYHRVYATKNRLGNKIWQSIVNKTAGGQRGFAFE